MTEQELRDSFIKKLTRLLYDLDINIYIHGTNKIFATFGLANEDIEHIADRLIAAEIGDVSEWKHRAELAEKVIANILCADACYCCNQKYGECNVQHRDYGSKECVDRLLMLTQEDL